MGMGMVHTVVLRLLWFQGGTCATGEREREAEQHQLVTSGLAGGRKEEARPGQKLCCGGAGWVRQWKRNAARV